MTSCFPCAICGAVAASRCTFASEIGLGLGFEKTGDQRKLLVIEPVMRHGGFRIVGFGISNPFTQPLRFHLGADARQFRTDIAAHQRACRILHGVAGGAERFAVGAGAGLRVCIRRGGRGSARGRRASFRLASTARSEKPRCPGHRCRSTESWAWWRCSHKPADS